MSDKTKQNHKNHDAKIREVAVPKKKQLRQEVTAYQQIFEVMPLMCWYRDLPTGAVRANQAALSWEQTRHLAAVTADAAVEKSREPNQEVAKTTDASVISPEDMDIIATKQAKLGIIETYHNASSGQAVWLRTDKVPHLDAENNTVGLITFSTDITELQDAQEALAAQGERLAKIEHTLRAVLPED